MHNFFIKKNFFFPVVYSILLIISERNEDTSDETEKEINSKANDVIDAHTSFPASQETVRNVNSYNLTSTTESYGFNRSRNRVSDEDSYNVSSNGSAQRSPAVDNYIFPKKVSDAETRSFVRSRCDARRNSTCTQIMMETFQSSFSLAVLRPWITAMLSVILKCYFLLTGKFPFFQVFICIYVFNQTYYNNLFYCVYCLFKFNFKI